MRQPSPDMHPSPAGDVTEDVVFSDLGCSARERGLYEQACALHPSEHPRVLGRVVRLDRGYPLVCHEGGCVRAEHAVALVKGSDTLSCVGDWVVLELPHGNADAIITEVLPRRCVFARKDPVDRLGRQVLATNVDVVLVLYALSSEGLQSRRLERELVIAHESGADVAVVLTKADLAASSDSAERDRAEACRVAPGCPVIVESAVQGRGIEDVRALIPRGRTAVMLGSSGVGKSSLANALLGEERLETGAVRESDDKGRHTTVTRQMIAIPGGGVIVDIPGIRAMGLWDSEEGIARTFPEIVEASAGCRFRDCAHTDEPGCAVRAAVEEGRIDADRLEAYRALTAEAAEMAEARKVHERLRRHQRDARR